jgi:hypothetical protein
MHGTNIKPKTRIFYDDATYCISKPMYVCMRRTSDQVRQITDILSGQKDSYLATNYWTM